MEIRQRKQNRIAEYDYSTNGAYFVTICTQDRKKILSEIVGDDAHIVPKPYGYIAEKYIRNVPEIEKYVIMPDHIHMIIRLDNSRRCRAPRWVGASGKAQTPSSSSVTPLTSRKQSFPSLRKEKSNRDSP